MQKKGKSNYNLQVVKAADVSGEFFIVEALNHSGKVREWIPVAEIRLKSGWVDGNKISEILSFNCEEKVEEVFK